MEPPKGGDLDKHISAIAPEMSSVVTVKTWPCAVDAGHELVVPRRRSSAPRAMMCR